MGPKNGGDGSPTYTKLNLPYAVVTMRWQTPMTCDLSGWAHQTIDITANLTQGKNLEPRGEC